MVKTLEQHLILLEAARKQGVLVMCEVHKRFDPIYTDARDRIQLLGNFSYINAYMSQPKKQLETFKAWAGKSSDIRWVPTSAAGDDDACVWILGACSLNFLCVVVVCILNKKLLPECTSHRLPRMEHERTSAPGVGHCHSCNRYDHHP